MGEVNKATGSSMTDQEINRAGGDGMTEEELHAFNARIDRDRKRWWTRWMMVQGREMAIVAVIGFSAGIAVTELAY